MKCLLQSRLPLTVYSVAELYDYSQVVTDNAIINIFNPICSSVPIQSLVHHQIVNIFIVENIKMVFLFENGAFMYVLIKLNKDIFSPTALKQNYSNASEPVFLSRLIIPTPL